MTPHADMQQILTEIYDQLLDYFGPQYWWPAETRFEVIVGAILTQNTNWSNVEKAIANLRSASVLCIEKMEALPPADLEKLIRPSGFFRQKTVRLLSFIHFVRDEFAGNLDGLFVLPPEMLRNLLLEQPGIGPETADSIILYAAGQPSFVVDAYTHRILERIGLEPGKTDYDTTRDFFMSHLRHDTDLFNEYHALLVRLAKEYCRKRNPLCSACPILLLCNHGRAVTDD